jgi:hypothetical protein
MSLSILYIHHPHGRVLIEASSVAIWNGDKIVVAIATSLWVTDVAVVIQGKSLPPNSCGKSRIFANMILHQASRG